MVAALISLMLLHVASAEQAAAAVDITGISRVLVLIELYNNARCTPPWNLRKRITLEEANALIGEDVGEIYGVIMNIRVPKEDEESKLDARAYNEANGDGRAERVIEKMRRKIGNGDVYGNTQSCTEVRCNYFNRENCELFCKSCAVCVGATAAGAAVGAGCGACCGAIGICAIPYAGPALGVCLGCGVGTYACCNADYSTTCVGMGLGAAYGAVIGATLGPAAVAAAGAGIGACVGAAAGAGAGANASVIMVDRHHDKEGNPQEDSGPHETESPGAANPVQGTEPGPSARRRVWKETRV